MAHGNINLFLGDYVWSIGCIHYKCSYSKSLQIWREKDEISKRAVIEQNRAACPKHKELTH